MDENKKVREINDEYLSLSHSKKDIDKGNEELTPELSIENFLEEIYNKIVKQSKLEIRSL